MVQSEGGVGFFSYTPCSYRFDADEVPRVAREMTFFTHFLLGGLRPIAWRPRAFSKFRVESATTEELWFHVNSNVCPVCHWAGHTPQVTADHIRKKHRKVNRKTKERLRRLDTCLSLRDSEPILHNSTED